MFYCLPLIYILDKFIKIKHLIIIGLLIETYYILDTRYMNLGLVKVTLPQVFPVAFIYLVLGMIIARNKLIIANIINLFKLKLFLIAFLILYFLENIIVNHLIGGMATQTIFMIPTSILIVCYSVFSTFYVPMNKTLRELSTFIYCVHLFFVKLISPITFFSNSFLNVYTQLTIVIILCIISYRIWYFLLKKLKIRILRFLI